MQQGVHDVEAKAAAGEFVGLSHEEAVEVGHTVALANVRAGMAAPGSVAEDVAGGAAAPAAPVAPETLATRPADASDIETMDAAKEEIIQLRFALRAKLGLHSPIALAPKMEDFASLSPAERRKRDREHQLAGAAERARIEAELSGGYVGLGDAAEAEAIGEKNNYATPKGEVVEIDGGDAPGQMPAALRAKLDKNHGGSPKA